MSGTGASMHAPGGQQQTTGQTAGGPETQTTDQVAAFIREQIISGTQELWEV